jgi:hypothetical protein
MFSSSESALELVVQAWAQEEIVAQLLSASCNMQVTVFTQAVDARHLLICENRGVRDDKCQCQKVLT